MNIHYLQHVPYEGIGFMREWIENKGYSVKGTQLYQDFDRFPSLEDFDFLIILGGSMNIYEEQEFPWIKKEKEFIQSAIEAKKMVLGICMGAQLIASILGAKVYKNEYEEIGWHRIYMKENTGSRNKELSFFPNEFDVLQWHGDTFELPKGATLLAESKACKNQAFIMKDHVIALQFHLEFTKDIVKYVAQHEEEISSGEFVQTLEAILQYEDKFLESKKVLHRLLDYVNRKYMMQ